MNDRQKKLFALYNDSSITLEEKRSIAVKLIDLGILEYSVPKKEVAEKYIEYNYNGLRYKQDINSLFKSYQKLNLNYQDVHDTMRRKQKEVMQLESKLEYETKIKSRLKLIFILIIIIDIIIIFIK